jgi:hypothetical protein
MNCTNCGNPVSEGVKFCGKCGTPIGATAVKKKAVRGVRVFIGIVVAIFIFGILAKALGVIINISGALAGVDSTEGLRTLDDVANIVGFLGGAYLANLVYISIAGKDRSSEKKKWYQFAGFMSTGSKTKSRPILAGVIIVITIIAFVLWVGVDSLQKAREKAVESGQYTPTTDNWIDYNATESNFSAKFPSRPVHDTQNQNTANGTIKIDTYKQADNTASILYAVNVTELPSSTDLSDPDTFLTNTVSLSAKNGTVLNSSKTTNNGYPAVSYYIEFDYPTEIAMIKGLNVLVGHRMYQLLTGYDKPQENILEYDKFVDSFQIK